MRRIKKLVSFLHIQQASGVGLVARPNKPLWAGGVLSVVHHGVLRKMNFERKMNFKKLAIPAVLAFGLVGQAAAVPFIIDDFSIGQDSGAVLNGSPYTGSVIGPATSIIGGQRDMTVTNIGTGESRVSIDGLTAGELEVSNTSNANAIVEVLWDAAGAGLTDGSGGVDLTVSGVNSFLSMFVTNIDLNQSVEFFISDSANAGFESTGPQNFVNAGVFQVPLASFTIMDVSDVDAIKMVLSSSAVAWDGRVDFISTDERFVPVPAPLALMGLGILGLVSARRLKKH